MYTVSHLTREVVLPPQTSYFVPSQLRNLSNRQYFRQVPKRWESIPVLPPQESPVTPTFGPGASTHFPKPSNTRSGPAHTSPCPQVTWFSGAANKQKRCRDNRRLQLYMALHVLQEGHAVALLLLLLHTLLLLCYGLNGCRQDFSP